MCHGAQILSALDPTLHESLLHITTSTIFKELKCDHDHSLPTLTAFQRPSKAHKIKSLFKKAHRVLQFLAAAAACLSHPALLPSHFSTTWVGCYTFPSFCLPVSVSVLPLLGNLKGHFPGKTYPILENILGFSVNP